MKPDTVKIIDISTSYEPKILSTAIYGLGDDGLMYIWSKFDIAWFAYTKNLVISIGAAFVDIDGNEVEEAQP